MRKPADFAATHPAKQNAPGLSIRGRLIAGFISLNLTAQAKLNLSILLLPGKAVAAIHRAAVFTRPERKASNAAAFGASGFEKLALTVAAALPGVAAILAACRLVLEALFSIEFLFTGGENEFVAAFLADEILVFEHGLIYLAIKNFYPWGTRTPISRQND